MTTRTLISDAELHRGRTRVWYFATLAVVTTLFVAVFVFPLYWMVTSALKTPAEYALTTPTFVPETFEPQTYADAWSRLRIARYLGSPGCHDHHHCVPGCRDHRRVRRDRHRCRCASLSSALLRASSLRARPGG